MRQVNSVIASMNKVRDIVIERDATDYIKDNYSYIINATNRMACRNFPGVHIQVEDIVHDVYLSLDKDEKMGRGFALDRNIELEQFVFGRIQKYMKNTKYRGITRRVNKTGVVYEERNESSSEDLSLVYMSAADMKDEIAGAENCLDMSEEIYNCLRAGKSASIDIKTLITNSDMFATTMAKNVMPIVKKLLDKDGLMSLINILEYRKQNSGLVDVLVERMSNLIAEEDASRA